jgi:endonuclease YncB( thermonuclease family)
VKRFLRWFFFVLIIGAGLVVAYLVLSSPRAKRSPRGLQPPDRARCRVSRVVDGDTLRLRLVEDPGAGEVVLRVKGIDCPESRWNNKCERDGRNGRRGCRWQLPHGQAATRVADKWLRGREVVLECGGHCRKGGYGRALRYVRLEDGRDYGLEMIKLGLCEDFGYRYPHPRTDAYLQAQRKARAEGLGQWAR